MLASMPYTNTHTCIFSTTKKPKTQTKNDTEVTLTFHLSGHRLVGLQPVLRVTNIGKTDDEKQQVSNHESEISLRYSSDAQ